MKLLSRAIAGLGLALLSATGPALAQGYPAKPIRMIVPYTPGGSIDTVGRIVADEMQRILGQPIVIDNKPGASGMIGSQEAARAPADGYTLLFNASSQVYMPLVIGRKTYDAEKDFTPVAQVGYVPLAVVLNPAVPGKTLAEFAASARSQPGKLTWATSGLGTTSHLTEEMINRQLKLDMEIVLYKGAAPQLTDVVGGHVSAAVSPLPGVSPFIKAGKLKAVAVTSAKRLASMPDVPTVAESGMPGFELLSWYGLWGPANMSKEVVAKLNAAVHQAVKNPTVRARFAELSFETADNTPAQFAGLIQDEIRRVGQVVKAANIRIDP
ncbi:Bug family tripartite tricarboxylate transporter substrate binding protein [Azohydromonas lata]|uniref:Tripartite tricarboxylate transporter substrate binding protein n=1 Tax=Azohydromonas lata TaxID=45677 RepID=A0ABU5IFP1_9BURK|nr:tripartite tricarboxylate transporter substrate binding protein [Azohydromonas lata]MDZ5456753.1 tripartite tricarboxylate transporter substrate binding protein [Azohydromonas lata]